MKKTITDDRYEERGSPLCWVWLFIAAMWGMNLALRIAEGDADGVGLAAYLLLMLASGLCAVEWARYRLVVDEQGVFQQRGWAKLTLTWADIASVTVHNRVSLSKSTGVTFCTKQGKRLYVNKTEILPLVQRFARCPVRTDE